MMDKVVVLAQNLIIETSRLKLRPVNLGDCDDLFAYASDAKVAEYIFDEHQTVADTSKVIATFFMSCPLGKYAIELKSTGKMIGTVDLRLKEANQGEIGYVLNQNYWGFGYMSEAGLALIDLGFKQCNLASIYSCCDVKNVKSVNVMMRLGMKHEGVLVKSKEIKGKIVDFAYYRIINPSEAK
ncbi:MAG: GNAT family N-acetyltransferase [Culicoidibacterales bacterium]